MIKLLPLTFALLWSTGFIGAKYGLPFVGPYTFLAMRFVITLVLLAVVVAIIKPTFPTRKKEYFTVFLSGIFIHVIYLGSNFSAMNIGLPAGITAVIGGLQPILTTLYIYRLSSKRALIIAAIGFVGLLLVVLDAEFSLASIGTEGLLYALLAVLGITVGTIYQKKYCMHIDVVSITFLQYIPTLIIFTLLALFFEADQAIVWNQQLLFALIWLSVVLSIGAILLMSLLYKFQSASDAANYFYLAPPFVLIQGYLFFNELITWVNFVGIVLVVLSIYLTSRKSPMGCESGS